MIVACCVSACGPSHGSASPTTTTSLGLTTTTFAFPNGLPANESQVLLTGGRGDATISVDLPKGTYSFQAKCVDAVPLAIPGTTTFDPCPAKGGNTVTAMLGPLHSIQIQTATNWKLYIGRPSSTSS